MARVWTCPDCGATRGIVVVDGETVAEMRERVRRLAEAAANLYCSRRRQGWEGGVTEDDAAEMVMHLVANEGIDVHARLMVWRGQHSDEAALTAHREECDGCAECEPDDSLCGHLNVKEGAGGFGECQDCGEEVV